jgi:hypothetical protein
MPYVFRNIHKCLNKGFSVIIMVAMNEKLEKGILFRLKEILRSQPTNIAVIRLKKYLRM